jgi:exosortase
MTIEKRLTLFGLYSLVLVLMCVQTVRSLFEYSRQNDYGSHVVLIPLVTLLLIAQERKSIFSSVRFDWVPGLLIALAGLGLATLPNLPATSSNAGAGLSLAVAAYLLIWIGGFIVLFGRVVLRAAIFPIGFLIFTVPIPPLLLAGAIQVLKHASADVVAALFALTGTPTHRDGFVFTLPSLVIEVADECSGIRSSIGLLLTSLLAGNLFLRNTWGRILLLVVVLPITVFKNGVRIVSLSLLAIHVDPGFIVGRLHHEGGIVFFLLALAIFMPVVGLLYRLEIRREAATMPSHR